LGPSAFSTIRNRRWQNVANTTRYIEAIQSGADPTQFSEPVPPRTRKAESLAFGLRTNRGVPKNDLESVSDELPALIDAGYVSDDGHRIRLTQTGKLVADSIAELLV
jgi:oxygen-independent coproporphyrinogen-3 oxidase